MRKRYRTLAFVYAEQRGWGDVEIAHRTGLSYHTVFSLRTRRRACGPVVIAGIQRAFPDVAFDSLFYVEQGEPQPVPQRRRQRGAA